MNKYYCYLLVLIIFILVTSLKQKCHECYFDNNSTTLIYNKYVIDEITKWMICGNPSNNLHKYGEETQNKIIECRNNIAYELNVPSNTIYFTSGATESNNIAIQGIINNCKLNKFAIITSECEHSSVLDVCKNMEKDSRVKLILLKPENKHSMNYGCINTNELEQTIKNLKIPVLLISIMHGNNETGAINDIYKIGLIAKQYGSIFHCDVTQTIGKYIIHPSNYNIDALSFSGHKFHGPKGIGCLYMNVKFENLCYGGKQELGRRPGTENVSGIVGMSSALTLVHQDRLNKNYKLNNLRNYLISELNKFTDIEIIGPSNHNNILPNTILLILNNLFTCNVEFTKLLNKYNIYISTGSACKKGQPSHILDAMNIDENKRDKVIRISLSDYTTFEECKYFINVMKRLDLDSDSD